MMNSQKRRRTLCSSLMQNNWSQESNKQVSTLPKNQRSKQRPTMNSPFSSKLRSSLSKAKAYNPKRNRSANITCLPLLQSFTTNGVLLLTKKCSIKISQPLSWPCSSSTSQPHSATISPFFCCDHSMSSQESNTRKELLNSSKIWGSSTIRRLTRIQAISTRHLMRHAWATFWFWLINTWKLGWAWQLFNSFSKLDSWKNAWMCSSKKITKKKPWRFWTNWCKKTAKIHVYCACWAISTKTKQNTTNKLGKWATITTLDPCDPWAGSTTTEKTTKKQQNASTTPLKPVTIIPTPGLL